MFKFSQDLCKPYLQQCNTVRLTCYCPSLPPPSPLTPSDSLTWLPHKVSLYAWQTPLKRPWNRPRALWMSCWAFKFTQKCNLWFFLSDNMFLECVSTRAVKWYDFLKTQINVFVAVVNHYHSNYCSFNLKIRLIRKKQVNILNVSVVLKLLSVLCPAVASYNMVPLLSYETLALPLNRNNHSQPFMLDDLQSCRNVINQHQLMLLILIRSQPGTDLYNHRTQSGQTR